MALTVRAASSAAAAGLRMLDGVRMLGPSLAKLCEMPVGDGVTNSNSSISAALCIAIHRTTVKNAARTLENLAKAIQEDPLKGPFHRPKDASVSSVSRDAVFAIRLISPFVSAYKSVSKRRALPWDPNMGEEAGELDSFVRYLIMRLLNSLKGTSICRSCFCPFKISGELG
jgi:exocyst complex protein 7